MGELKLAPLVITPGLFGHDGISQLSREVLSAVGHTAGQRTVEVWSWAESDTSLPASPGVTVRFAARRYGSIARWLFRELIRPQRGRLVIVLHAHLSPLAIPLVFRGASLVQFLLGVEVFRKLRVLERWTLERATCLVAISHHTLDEFVRRNASFRRDRLNVCHPGAPESHATGNDVVESGFALVVGRMAASERYKGHDLLLEIWPRVLKKVPSARLIVVGDGDDRPRLQQKAAELGLSDHVRFEGNVGDARLDSLYWGSLFFVMPSAREGFGLVFLEAMRCAKACIAGTGAPAEIVLDGETGFVVPPTDAAALEESVIRLFECEDLRTTMGERGRERFEAHFTSRQFRERLGALLADCDVPSRHHRA